MRCSVCASKLHAWQRRAGNPHLDCVADRIEERPLGQFTEDHQLLVKSMSAAEVRQYVERLRNEADAIRDEADLIERYVAAEPAS